MTPEDAVVKLTERIMRMVWTERELADVLGFFDSVKTTAKADETRRCAARVKGTAMPVEHDIAAVLENLADDLLHTGGLEVEK